MKDMKEIIITNPLSPKSLYCLFFKPTKLFAPDVHLKSRFWIIFFVFPFFGFDNLISRYLIQNTSDIFFKFGNKAYFIEWITALIFCVFIWYIGGYFFNLKLKWSGAINFNKTESKILMIYTNFIISFFNPIIIFLFYKNHIDENSLWFSFFLSLTYIYSNVICYLAVKNKFNVSGIKPLFWFVLFPAIFYIIILYSIVINNFKSLIF